jgi:hypothetical protein
VAGRAQVPEILTPVVEAVAVDVVDLQDETSALPHIAYSACGTDTGNAEFVECAPEESRLGAAEAGLPLNEDVGRRFAALGRDATAVPLADEVVDGDAVCVQAALHTSATRTGVGDAELVEYGCETP